MIGTELGSYRIVEQLGEGGMGVVYKAVDTSLDRLVAVKVLNSDYTRNPELVERFRMEARAQANLNHTNIAMLHAFVAQGGQAWMVMEYIEGETISQMIQRRGLLPPQVAVPLFKQALLGIGFAHRAGIIHRDIKPSNLMVNRQGIVKVMDFGIAKVLGSRGMTRTGMALGTSYYMSPEQVMSGAVDIRSDIYSLGVTLFEMLTANVPFQADTEFQILTMHVHAPPPLPTRFYPYIPKAIENAVLKALAKDPNERFQTVEEFGAALERTDDGVAVPVSAPPVGAQTAPRMQAMATPAPVAAPPPRVATPPPMPPPPPVTGPAATPPPVASDPLRATFLPPPPPPPSYQTPAPAAVTPPPVAAGGAGFLASTKGKLVMGGGVALVAAIVLLSLPRHGTVVPPPITPTHDENPVVPKQPNQEVSVWPPAPAGQSDNTAAQALKIVAFDARTKRVRPGQKAVLSWSVEGASAVTISPSVGDVSPQGSTNVAVDRTTQFTLTAKTLTGEQVQSTVVVEVAPGAPSAAADLKVAFDVQPVSIASGQTALLRWSVPGAQSVDIEPGVGSVPATGSRQVRPAYTTSYSLLARGSNGAAGTGEVTLQVQPPPTPTPTPTPESPKPTAPAAPAAPIVSLMATPNQIQAGGSATLAWSIRNAYSAAILPAPGVLKQAVGQFMVSPQMTTTYTLIAKTRDGTMSTATATVQVMAPAPVQVPAPQRPVAPTTTMSGASTRPILVVHDHGILNAAVWPSCWGSLQVVNGMLRYAVAGTNDGRRDDFQVPVSDIEEVKMNKLRIRNQPAFHIEVRRQHFNFVSTGMAATEAVNELEGATRR